MGSRSIILLLLITANFSYAEDEILSQTARDRIRTNAIERYPFFDVEARVDMDTQLARDLFPAHIPQDDNQKPHKIDLPTIKVTGLEPIRLADYLTLLTRSIGYTPLYVNQNSKNILVDIGPHEASLDIISDFLTRKTNYKLLIYPESRLISVLEKP